MYAMVCTKLDIAHAVRVVSRYMSNPRNSTRLVNLGFSAFDSILARSTLESFLYIALSIKITFILIIIFRFYSSQNLYSNASSP
jgi:hypothetical protein